MAEGKIDERMTVAQGMEFQSLQFEEGCGRVVCVDVWGENCHCMDAFCKENAAIAEKRAAILKQRAQGEQR